MLTEQQLNRRGVMEPGENPGRTGHCECGAFFIKSLAHSREDERRDDAESGYLLRGK